MARCVDRHPLQSSGLDPASIHQKFIDRDRCHPLLRREPQKAGLHLNVFVEEQVIPVEEDTGVGLLLEPCRPADMVNMGVRVKDGAGLEAELRQPGENSRDLIPRVDDDCFFRFQIAQDDAIALEWADGDDFENLFHVRRVIMPSAPFQPLRVFVERSVRELPLTIRTLAKLPQITVEVVEDARAMKRPAEMAWAKKGLLLARKRTDPLKEFPAMSASNGRPYFSLDLISNCHLECTYCILQSYLENNPVITVFTNLEEILERLQGQIAQLPQGSIVGTGRLADSLALDEMTEQTKWIVPFFGRQNKITLEIKTKSDRVENLLGLDHRRQTVVSWSMNPPNIIEREEYKTASFEERLEAARRVLREGYLVAFHFDPMIYQEKWREEHIFMLDQIFDTIPPEEIAWMSLGTLRFPARQARIMQKRFPKNGAILEPLVSTSRTVIHYPDDLREEMQSFMEKRILGALPSNRVYRCMDLD